MALIFLWMFMLHWAVQASPSVDIGRMREWNKLKPLTLGDFLEIPEISLQAQYTTIESWPEELKKTKEFRKLTDLEELMGQEEWQEAYVLADALIRKFGKSDLTERLLALRADLLLRVQLKIENGKLSLALEEYQNLIQKFPLHPEMSRLLFQIGFSQLKMGFYKDADDTATRGLKFYGKTELGTSYYLLRAEASFLSNNFPQANRDLGALIDQFPHSEAAIDAAFRKAFLDFRRGDFEGALTAYSHLEKFHSDVYEDLKMTTNAVEQSKLIDRAFFAETLYLNGMYTEASKLFQDLSNLFPEHPIAPILSIRFGDSFYQLGQFSGAEEVYNTVLAKYPKNAAAQSLARLRLADLYYVTRDLRAFSENDKLYEDAFKRSLATETVELSAFILARRIAYSMSVPNYPKAQRLLRVYRENFKKSRNEDWVNEEYITSIEKEILSYFDREDYMAALAVYLVHDRQNRGALKETKVLLKLAEAAQHLDLLEQTASILNRVIYLEKTAEGRQEALLKLVDVLILQKDYRKASERLRRFNFAYPTSTLKALYNRLWGDVYAALKNSEKAAEHYELALSSARSQPDLYFEMRDLYLRLADHYQSLVLPVKAIEAYRTYMSVLKEIEDSALSSNSLKPRDRFLRNMAKVRIADLYFRMTDYVRAIDAYQQVAAATSDEPFQTASRYRIGECLLALGDRAAAIEAFKTVNTKDPTNLWGRSAVSYIKTVEMESKYGIKIFN